MSQSYTTLLQGNLLIIPQPYIRLKPKSWRPIIWHILKHIIQSVMEVECAERPTIDFYILDQT